MSLRKELLTPKEAQAFLEPIDVEVVNRVRKATVNIACTPGDSSPFALQQEKYATGIHIGDGRIITAYHTLKNFPGGLTMHVVSQESKTPQEAQMVYADDSLDFAIVHMQEANTLGQVEVQPKQLTQYQTVLVAAYPTPFTLSTFRGIYLGDIPDFDPDNTSGLAEAFLFYDAVDPEARESIVRHGASGGGVFNSHGQLVGMMFGRITVGESRVLALQGRKIHRLLQASGLSS